MNYSREKIKAGVEKHFDFGIVRFFLWCCILQSYFEAGNTGFLKNCWIQHCFATLTLCQAKQSFIPGNSIKWCCTPCDTLATSKPKNNI